jgi:P27 family predicted phage terminase small subunit
MARQLESKTGFRLEEIPPPPESLSPGAVAHWLELLPIIFELGTARVCDIPALILLCEARADLDALQSAIRSEGITTEAGSGGRKANPALRSLEVALRQVETMLDRFGLIPGSFPRKAPSYADHLDHHKRMNS